MNKLRECLTIGPPTYPWGWCNTHQQWRSECYKVFGADCPSCAAKDAELTRLRSLAERAEDVEKIEDIIEEHLAMTLGVPTEWYMTSHVGEVSVFARAIVAYLKGEER
jgi:hypothetical protein